MIEAEVPPTRNLSLRVRNAKALRRKLMEPENGRGVSSDLEVVSDYKAERAKLDRMARLAEHEKKCAREARFRRSIELLSAYQTALKQWVGGDGAEPAAPAIPRLTVSDVLAAVSAYYGIPELQIISARRSADVLRPRMVAVFLSKENTPYSFPIIARRMGGRDHTTALNAFERAKFLMEQGDERLITDIAAIRKALNV